MNKNITFISGNKNKIKEFKDIIEPEFTIEVSDIDLPEIQSLDPKEVIEDKLNRVKNEVEGIFFVEDTCLVIDAYGSGLPGPLIKWFIQDKVEGLKNIVDYVVMKENPTATAITTIGLHLDGENYFFKGEISGDISNKVKGNIGFGWDDIFIPTSSDQTFGEMNLIEKNKYSMRKIAISKMLNFLNR